MAFKLSSTLVILVGITLILPIYAQEKREDYLEPHNAIRAKLGLPKLIWDLTLEEQATYHLERFMYDCNMFPYEEPEAENSARSSGNMTVGQAVKMWIDEKQYYNYDSNSCASNQTCGHYTKIVWRDTRRLGCAKFRCGNGTLITCLYDPPGNEAGKKPY